MRVIENQVVIDDAHLVHFFSDKPPEFLSACENIYKVIAATSSPSDQSIMTQLLQLKSDIVSSVKDDMFTAMSTTKFDFSDVINTVKSTSDTLSLKVDSFSQLRSTNTFKGKEGEQIVLDILKQNFHRHDGYTIEDTSDDTKCCDFVLKRVSYTDIRIESKAYGRDTGSQVNVGQVKKFISDLVQLNNHGIMVSLYSGIATKSSIDMEIVPTTNKFAFYVTGLDQLPDIIRLIYRLDTITRDDDGDSTTLTKDSVSQIREHINDFSKKREELEVHMNHSLRILKSMTYSVIEKIIFLEPPKNALRCQWCDHSFTSQKRLDNHTSQTCKKKPA
jgi:hypothetical protein